MPFSLSQFSWGHAAGVGAGFGGAGDEVDTVLVDAGGDAAGLGEGGSVGGEQLM